MATNKVKQELSCPICSNPFSNPLMMPCLHSFCKKCLEKQLEEQENSSETIKCPTCATVSPLPSGKVTSLPSNLWLAHQVEVSSYQQKIEGCGSIPCDRCMKKENGSAVAFCCNCCLFLCSSCKEDHQSWREMANHELVNTGEKKSNNGSNSAAKIPHKPVMCIKHSKEELKFYCETCQCLVCRDCIVVEHRDHERNHTDEVGDREREGLRQSLKETEDALAKLEAAIGNGEMMMQQVKDRKNQVNEEITKAFEEAHCALREREQILHAKCEEVATEKLTFLTMQLEEFQGLKEKVTFATQLALGALDHTSGELLSTKKIIQEQLQQWLNSVDQLELEPSENDDIAMVVDKASLVDAITKLGKVSEVCDPAHCTVEEGLAIPLATVGQERQVKVALRDSYGELVQGKVPVSARLKAKDGGSVLPAIVEGTRGHVTFSFRPVVMGEHQLTIKVKNRPISGPYQVWAHQGRNYQGIFSSRQSFNIGGNTRGVVVHHNGDVFATNIDSHCIQVFGSDGSEKLRFGSQGSGKGQFNIPRGLTLIGDVLYAVDYGNHRVQKFTITGDYLGRFGSKGSSNGRFSNPYGICMDGNGHILVADQGNQRVQVFTADGIFTSSFSCSSQPYDVAVDNTGNFHVALYNCVAVFSPDGQQLSTYNAGGKLDSPYAIAIDDNGYRFVSDDSNSCVHVIDPQGRLVSSFGSYHTRGITLDTHGDIYVNDYHNKCVYKY